MKLLRLFLAAVLLIFAAADVDARPRGIRAIDTSGFNGGLSETNFGGVEFMFLNIIKSAQNWSTITGANYPDPDATTGFNFDANGYPRQIVSGGVTALHVLPTDAERSWADFSVGVGAYTHRWDGGGTLTLTGYTLVSGSLTSAPGSTGNIITLRPTTNRPSIGISAVTSSTDYPHNFYLHYTADQADVTAGKVTSAQLRLRNSQAKIGMFRFLNYQAGYSGGGNQTMLTTWTSRKPVAHWTYGAEEIRTAQYAGVTTSAVADHYVLATFNDPTYGTAPAVDKQTIQFKYNSSQVGTRSYLDFNGREDLICNPYGSPADPTSSIANTGVPAINQYTTAIYDALLQCWLNFSSGNASPATRYLDNGVPPEVQLQMAIELGVHPWFLTPSFAADSGTGVGALTDFSSNQIDMVRAGAPAWMKPVFEPPNEWWNNAGAWYVTPWSYARQLVRYGGARPGQTAPAPFLVTSMTYAIPLSITGTGAGTGGKVRLTVSSTANLTTGEIRTVALAGGTTEANGVWPITVVDGTHVDLDGSTFVNAWTSGGTLSGQATMTASGTLPPLGAQITALNNQPSGLNGFDAANGYVTSVGAGTFTFDKTPTNVSTWAGNSGTATITLVGSTVAVPYTTADRNAIVLSTTGTLPAPLVAGTVYYVRTGGAGATPFEIALTPGGAAIDFSAGSQSGVHTAVQVLAFTPAPTDNHNAYGTSAANLGQLLASKYGLDPKTQTAYKMVIGVQGGIANYYPSNVAGSDPRATSKYSVINTASAANMAKLTATHVSPANYYSMSARASGAQETALSNRWNGTLFTAGIVNGTMTIASFQNAGTANMAAGQVVFGFGLPAPFGASQVTIVSGPAGCTTTCTGTGVYILSDNTINVATGTQLYSGADYTAVQEYIDSANGAQITATIDNGSGGSGNQMVVSAISPTGALSSGTIYLTSQLNGVPVTAATTINSQSSGTTGSTGTYIISRNHLVTTPTAFTANGPFSLQQVNTNLSNWKTWAKAFDITNMVFYEGGYSDDYTDTAGGTSTSSTTFAKVNLLRFAAKWALSSTAWPAGIAGTLAQNYAYVDAMTDGTFTATFPSSYYFDGRYPSNNAWSVWEDIYFPLTPPQVQAITTYNTN
jgi:hypothetical protein